MCILRDLSIYQSEGYPYDKYFCPSESFYNRICFLLYNIKLSIQKYTAYKNIICNKTFIL